VGEHQGGAGGVPRRLAGGDEDAGADDRADAQCRERHRPQDAAEAVVAGHLVEEDLQGLLGEQLIHCADPGGGLLSRRRVTGPSLTSSTCIMAPKRPVAVGTPWARTAVTNASYSGTAISGGAASTKLGRRPLRQSPYRV